LAYLAVTGASHRRDRLAVLFWPESDAVRAQNALRYTLSLLRKALNGAWLVVDRETVGLDGSEKRAVDVVRFRDLLAECRAHGHPGNEVCPECWPLLIEAVELYQGDFMAGFTLRGSSEFDDWQALETEALRRELAGALERLVGGYAAQGEVERGMAYAQRWLALDALDEAAHRCLMRLYAGSGQQAAALRQYEMCERVLREELGVSPSRETRALCQAIREGRVPQLQVSPPAFVEVPAAPRHNLPAQPTPFVGREGELDQMAELLGDPGCRLLTVVGAGGMGKTRLAIQAAEEHLQAFADGAWFVPLASLESVDLLASTILDVLDVPLSESVHPKEQLLHVLRGRKVLLVLDNFEHLLEGTALVTEMLREAPHLKVVVTSRERLNVRGEWLLPLGGMEYPEEEMAGVREEEYSAIELFVQCARRVRPDFTLARAGAPWVARICQLVEGMPLAIELAAPRVRVMECEGIAEEIEGGLGFLATTLRDVPERHRSMRAVFDHSWGLLSDEERSVLRKLSMFRGGFRREAGEAVAGASLEVLSSLVDKSWVRSPPSGRYEMHELIRQYASEHLEGDPAEGDQVRDRHSRYYGAFLEEREESLHGWGQAETFREILEEMDNVWYAWRWAVERGHVETLGRIVEALWRMGVVRGWYHEVSQALEQAATMLRLRLDVTALDRGSPAREEGSVVLADILSRQAYLHHLLGLPERAMGSCRESLALLQDVEHGAKRDSVYIYAKLMLGQLLRASGDSTQCEQLFREALAHAEEAGDPWGREDALFWLGNQARNEGRYSEAERFLRQGIAIADETGEQWVKAAYLENLSYVLCAEGEYERAEILAQESLQIRQEIGDRRNSGYSFVRLGEIATALGRYELAGRYFQRSLGIAKEIGDAYIEAEALNGQGTLALALGDHAETKGLFAETLSIAREGRHAGYYADALTGLGRAALGLGEVQQARERFRQGLEAAMKAARLPTAVRALVGLAHLWSQEAELEGAVEWLALVLHHPATCQIERDRAQHLLSELTRELPPEVFTAAVTRGQARELEEVAAEIVGRNVNTSATGGRDQPLTTATVY